MSLSRQARFTIEQTRVLTAVPDADCKRALVELRRAGAIVWDGRSYRLLTAMRQTITAVLLLRDMAPADESAIDAQARLFGVDDDDTVAMSGLVGILAADCDALADARQLPAPAAAELAGQIKSHIADAERVLEGLRRQRQDSETVQQAVELVARLAGGITDLVERLALEARDLMPRQGERLPRAELRERVATLTVSQLAAGVRLAAAPRAGSVPHGDDLCAALVDVGQALAVAPLPTASRPNAIASASRDEDPLDLLEQQLGSRPLNLTDLLVADADWSAALAACHTTARLHARRVSTGRSGVRAGALIEAPIATIARVRQAQLPHDDAVATLPASA